MSAVWDGFTVGPDDWLILIVRDGMSRDAVMQAKERLPTALHGRVMVVDGFDGFVVKKADA